MGAGRRYTIWYSARVFDHGRQSTIAEADKIGGRILDVGVGTGLSLSDYSPTTKLCGVDISEPMLRKAQRRVRALGLPNVETLAVMDAKNLAFPNGFFRRRRGAICHHRGARSGGYVGRFHPRAETRRRTHSGQSHRRRKLARAVCSNWRSRRWRAGSAGGRNFLGRGWSNWAAGHGDVSLTERRPMPPMGHFSLIRYRKS